jgi:hypothetical protein
MPQNIKKHVSAHQLRHANNTPSCRRVSQVTKPNQNRNNKITIIPVTRNNRRGAPPTYPFHSICNFQRTIRYLKRRPKTWRHPTSGGGFYSPNRAVSTQGEKLCGVSQYRQKRQKPWDYSYSIGPKCHSRHQKYVKLRAMRFQHVPRKPGNGSTLGHLTVSFTKLTRSFRCLAGTEVTP